MRKIALTILAALISFPFLTLTSIADDIAKQNKTNLNFFTGMFDFSDHKQKAGVIGIYKFCFSHF